MYGLGCEVEAASHDKAIPPFAQKAIAKLARIHTIQARYEMLRRPLGPFEIERDTYTIIGSGLQPSEDMRLHISGPNGSAYYANGIYGSVTQRSRSVWYDTIGRGDFRAPLVIRRDGLPSSNLSRSSFVGVTDHYLFMTHFYNQNNPNALWRLPLATAIDPYSSVREASDAALASTKITIYDELGRQVSRLTYPTIEEAVRSLPERGFYFLVSSMGEVRKVLQTGRRY